MSRDYYLPIENKLTAEPTIDAKAVAKVKCDICGITTLYGAIVGDFYLCDKCYQKEVDKYVSETKMTPAQAIIEDVKNQSIKADAGKPQLHLVPTEIINCIARVREFGNKKYKDSNSWKRVEKERYIDAMFRHLLKYVNDNNSVDEESGMPHLWHLACNVAFLCEMMKEQEE